MVALYNHSSETAIVKQSERVAQFIITPYLHAKFENLLELSNTVRGVGGFGSTGK